MIHKRSLTLSILALFLPSCYRARDDRRTAPAPSGRLLTYEVCVASCRPAPEREKVHELKALSLEVPEQAGDNGRTALASPPSLSPHEVRSATQRPVPDREEQQEMKALSPKVPEQAESEEAKQTTADCTKSEKPKPVATLVEDYFSLEKATARREKARQAFELTDPDEIGGDYYFSYKPSLQKVLIKKGQDVELALRNAFKRLNR